MVGAGHVGLVTGACFSEFGVDVTCVDTDRDKLRRLEAGEMPLYEPGLADLVARNMAAGRFAVAADPAAVAGADAAFIAVGTPSRGDDGRDLRRLPRERGEDGKRELAGEPADVD